MFAEFFAGMGGFSEAMKLVGTSLVEVRATLDGYAGEWNILAEEDYEMAKQLCGEEIDHAHFAPACRTMSMARRSDQFGTVKVLRDANRPEGYGDKDAEESNEMVKRMVALCLMLNGRGATFAIENPWMSFLWLLQSMQKVMRMKNAELLCLHQCAYGASSVKPTGILTTAVWMKLVRSLCHEVREHLHATTLCGKAWDYVTEKWIWRTSLAAEYPCGLCLAWSKAFKCWMTSRLGRKWMEERSYKIVGRWRNVLVRASEVQREDKAQRTEKMTVKEKREEENKRAIGGLRNPQSAVSKNWALRQMGEKIRRVIEGHMKEDEVENMVVDMKKGTSAEWIKEIRKALCKEFGAKEEDKGLQTELWQSMLMQAEDADKEVLIEWMKNGFPLGIKKEIENTGIFPETLEDSAAVEASRVEGLLKGDYDGSLKNYVSFEEAGQPAEELLKEMERAGRTEVFASWDQVVQKVGPAEAVLTKLACITKLKESGELKHRLVVDCRRSGVNGLAQVRERVILPKVTDFVKSVQRILKKTSWNVDGSWQFELFSSDFSNAFYMCPLRSEERCFVIFKGRDGRYHVSRCVVFGLAAGPLLWARIASAAMRLAQATMKDHEAAISCYVDDPLLAILGPSPYERMKSFCICTLLWQSLGLDMAWRKSCHGQMVPWIGYEISLAGKAMGDVTVRMAENKRVKLHETFEQLLAYRGMMPLRLLQQATGVLGWASSILMAARPWLSMLYAASTQHQRTEPIRHRARERKGLVFVRQVDNALRWLSAMVQEVDALRPRTQQNLQMAAGCTQNLDSNGCMPHRHGRILDDGTTIYSILALRGQQCRS